MVEGKILIVNEQHTVYSTAEVSIGKTQAQPFAQSTGAPSPPNSFPQKYLNKANILLKQSACCLFANSSILLVPHLFQTM